MIARYALTALALAACTLAYAETTFYVASNGNDAWSGTLPAPNDVGDDGPFASLLRARDAVRALRVNGALPGPVTVRLRGGKYYLTETLTLGPEDSGAEDAPVTWAAFEGETPELIGGSRIEGPWREEAGGVLSAGIGDRSVFRQLFVDGQRMIRARFPDFDPDNPYRGGFMYAAKGIGSFGASVGNIHNRGDWMDYDVTVPADGEYLVWVRYGALNEPHGRTDMNGRTALFVDGGEATPLMNLPDTGGWSADKWSRSAMLTLTAGAHRIRWQNLEGGGLNLDAFALCTDADWTPVTEDLPPVADGTRLIIIQAEDCVAFEGKQLSMGGAGDKHRFYYKPGTMDPAWADAPDPELHIFPSGRSSCRAFKEILTLESVDEATNTVTVGGAECKSNLCQGDRFFVENVRELLDAPGEWYLDADAGRLYLMPGEGFGDDAEVVAPALERIVEVIAGEDEAVGHLRFEGLTLRCTDYSPDDNNAGYGMGSDGVIRLESATDCRVVGCAFTGIGKYAVCASGGGGHLISRNEIGQSASGGVLLLDSAGNEVSNNRIHDCGLVYKHIGGVAMQGEGAGDNLVAHNYIHDMTRYAITMKNAGLRNTVEFNWIERTNLETYDTGAIEVTQHDREVRSGSIIRNNIVGDTVGYSSRLEKPHLGAWGIYLDSYAGGYTVTNNICYRSPFGGIMFQGGHGNVVTNNIFVDGAQRQGALSNFRDGFADNVLERNVFYYTNPEALLFSGRPFTPDVMRVDNNVYYCPGIEEPVIRAGGAATWQQWLELGFDANSVIADPMFVDAENDDYTLAPDSPAFALGFEPIDIGRIGVD